MFYTLNNLNKTPELKESDLLYASYIDVHFYNVLVDLHILPFEIEYGIV